MPAGRNSSVRKYASKNVTISNVGSYKKRKPGTATRGKGKKEKEYESLIRSYQLGVGKEDRTEEDV